MKIVPSRSISLNERELQGLLDNIPEYRNWDARDIKHGSYSKIIYFEERARRVGGSNYSIAGQFGASTIKANIHVFGIYQTFRRQGFGTIALGLLEDYLKERHKIGVIEGMAFLPVGGSGARKLLPKLDYDLSGPVPRKVLNPTLPSLLPSSASST